MLGRFCQNFIKRSASYGMSPITRTFAEAQQFGPNTDVTKTSIPYLPPIGRARAQIPRNGEAIL